VSPNRFTTHFFAIGLIAVSVAGCGLIERFKDLSSLSLYEVFCGFSDCRDGSDPQLGNPEDLLKVEKEVLPPLY